MVGQNSEPLSCDYFTNYNKTFPFFDDKIKTRRKWNTDYETKRKL